MSDGQRNVWVSGGYWGEILCPPLIRFFSDRVNRDIGSGRSDSLVPLLRDALISVVVTLAFTLITVLGHHPQMLAWDVIAENAFSNQIILWCTGILAIAMMLGLVLSEKCLSGRQALLSFMLIVPLIFLLNLLRVAVVFIAVSDRWFVYFPDPTGTGDPHFFWAHNVFAEGLALLFLIWLLWALGRVTPGIGIEAYGSEVSISFAKSLIRGITRSSGGKFSR